jgi:hypothetical protein
VDARHRSPVAARLLDRRADRTVGAAPTDHEQIGVIRSQYLDGRDLVRDASDLLGAELDHPLVVLRVVGNVARDVLLGETADAVFELGRSGKRPGARQRLRIASIRLEIVGCLGHLDRGAAQ